MKKLEAEELAAMSAAYNSRPSLLEELTSLMNRYSRENESNTPDWILAEHLMNSLIAFETTSKARERWYGRFNMVGGRTTPNEQDAFPFSRGGQNDR